MSAAAAERRWRIPPAVTAMAFGVAVGAAILIASGADPLEAYGEIIAGALAWGSLPNTLNWAVPLVGMTLVAALPLRTGRVNLGGDGQLVLGGLVSAVVATQLPLPGPLAAVLAILAAMLAGGAYAALAAWGEVRHGVPMLISSLLLSYPAVGVASYLVSFPLRDPGSPLPQTVQVPAAARLPTLGGGVEIGVLLIALVAAMVVFIDRRSVAGYEMRMTGLNTRFAGYGGIRLSRQAYRVMFTSGAIAGLVGALVVLGSQFRFIDTALTAPAYTWSGLMAALLASGAPLGAIAAGCFFAVLQTGGFAMQRETEVPRVLTMVLQALIILFLSLRHGIGRQRR